MPLTLGWHDVALRLLLTVVASVLLGINRSERGRAAGLRTTVLVCLAASVSMIQANLLMPTQGKTPDSFVVLDLMRLPLGILTGMGFIGAGAILRRGNVVIGVTTAATLWLVTVIGLCLGGGQLVLGTVATGLALIVLWGLRQLEALLAQEHRATLVLRARADGPTEEEIQSSLRAAGYGVVSWGVAHKGRGEARSRTLRCGVRWQCRESDVRPPAFLEELSQRPGVLKVQWKE